MDVLRAHPELTPNVFKVLSDALTAAQQEARDLERRLQEQADVASSKNPGTSEISASAHTDAEFAALRDLYERERDSGRELRTTLEERFIELRTNETAVEENRRIMEEKMEDFRQRTEVLTQEAAAKASALQALLAAAVAEKTGLQEALDARKLDISAQDDALSALSAANQRLEEKFRASQTAAAVERSHELDRRRQLESALAAARTALAAKTTKFTAHVDAAEGALRTLRTKLDAAGAHVAATEAAHVRLEGEVREVRARQAALEQENRDLLVVRGALQESLSAQVAEQAAVEQANRDLLAVRGVLEAELGERRGEAARTSKLYAAAVAEQGRMEEGAAVVQAELGFLRTKAANLEEDNCVLLEARHIHDRERAALTEAVGARQDELQALRAKLDASVAELEELRASTSDARVAHTEHAKLKDTLKTRMLEISDFKKKIVQRDQYAAKVKAELVKQREDADARYIDLEKAYNNIHHELAAQEDMLKGTEDYCRALQKDVEKLQETNKNLRSSVLSAGVQAQQELQKAADEEQGKLQSKLLARSVENLRLQKALAALEEQFTTVNRERVELLERLAAIARDTAMKSIGGSGPFYGYATREADDDQASSGSGASQYFEHRYHGSERYSSGGDDEDQTESSDEQQWVSDDPDRSSPKEERGLYRQFMRSFLYPANRPPHKFDSFQPVHSIDTMKPLETFTHDLPTTRRTLHCPKRTIWCGGERVHALVFAPTHEYWYSSDKWIHKSKMNASVGETFDFFVNQGGSVYYAGIYKVHSLRTVHPPGAKITSDVSRLAIHRATGLSLHSTEDKVAECFPDGEIRTECFGLQCVGFDQTLYEGLYARFRIGRQNKRKAESEDLQADTRFKSQRVSY